MSHRKQFRCTKPRSLRAHNFSPLVEHISRTELSNYSIMLMDQVDDTFRVVRQGLTVTVTAKQLPSDDNAFAQFNIL